MTLKHLACSFAAAALSFSAAHAATTTINIGGSSLAAPTYIAEFKLYTASNPTSLFDYEAVGSGAGQNAFLNNNINYFKPVSATNTVGYAAGTLTYGTLVGTTVAIGASDATLAASQLTNPATGSYAESAIDGPLIQIPTLGVPITMAYNEAGVPAAGLTLTDSQICGVLSGKITDWHTLVATIPANTTIKVTYRTDSSGTTFLTTQHLNKVCTTTNSKFAIPVTITKTFATLFANSKPPTNFTGESGSSNVASHLVATTAGFGYLSPDFTSIAPKSLNTTTLRVANLVNATNGVAYAPTVANTTTGLAHAGAGSTNPTPPNTLAKAMNPLNWVPSLPIVTSGYPIVGYTTMDLSTCYATPAVVVAIGGFLGNSYLNKTYQAVATNNGFVPLTLTAASAYSTAIANIFLSNASNYNLNVENAKACASYKGR